MLKFEKEATKGEQKFEIYLHPFQRERRERGRRVCVGQWMSWEGY